MSARTPGTDSNEEITSVSAYVDYSLLKKKNEKQKKHEYTRTHKHTLVRNFAKCWLILKILTVVKQSVFSLR